MRQSGLELVTEVINNTCQELIYQLRRQFQNDSYSFKEQFGVTHVSQGQNTSDYSTLGTYGAAMLAIIFLVYQVFAVIRVTDKLALTYNSNSKLLQDVVKKTGLEQMAFRTCLAGQVQKLQMPLMLFVEKFNQMFCTEVTFHREIFKFHDGGQCALDWAFCMPQKTKYMTKEQVKMLVKDRKERRGSVNQQDSDQSADQSTESFLENNRPILVVFLGMCSDENEIYIQNLSRRAFEEGYQPVLIQFRGASGVKLTSPKTYGCGQWQDVEESVSYIYDEYCKDINRQMFGIGFSLGGNWLALALGKSEKLNKMMTAISVVESPLVISNAFYNLKHCWNGMINWNLGQRYRAQFKQNQEYLAPHFKQQFNVDLKKFVKTLNGASDVEEQVNWRMYGQKNFEAYQNKFSAHNYIQNVKVPFLVYHIDDDPIICPKCVPYEKILNMDNIIIASNKYGGHLSSHHSFFQRDQFFVEPPLEFFSYFKQQQLMYDINATFEKKLNSQQGSPSRSLEESGRIDTEASQVDISLNSSQMSSKSEISQGSLRNHNQSHRNRKKNQQFKRRKRYISI